MNISRSAVLALIPALLSGPVAGPTASRTRVVILGVSHSAQLVAESYQPAEFRAFFDRLHPDAVTVERPPEQFARGDQYEFTYEIQSIVLPYARAHHLPVFPVDWMPPLDDQLLGWGSDLDRPPVVRPRSGFQGFLVFADTATRHLPLFFADQEADRAENRAWYQQAAPPAPRDLARRLFLYRTFMQSRRIRHAAEQVRGGTLLVVIGSMHKDELERILAADPTLEIVQPSAIGRPDPAAVAGQVTETDRLAIATFNLLGLQSTEAGYDRAWLGRVVAALDAGPSSPETRLLDTRWQRLENRISPIEAALRYAGIGREAPAGVRFTWDGVKDRSRIDSYFDPFGNLDVGRRAWLEAAREYLAAGRPADAAEARRRVEDGLTTGQRAQLDAYWREYLAPGD